MNAEREWASKRTKSSKICKTLRPRWSGHKLSISHIWTRKAWKQRHSHWQWTSLFKEWRNNKNNDSWKYTTNMWTRAEWGRRTVPNDIGWSSERCNTISDETLCSISRMLRTTERRWKKLRGKVTETGSDKSSLHGTVLCRQYSQPGSINSILNTSVRISSEATFLKISLVRERAKTLRKLWSSKSRWKCCSRNESRKNLKGLGDVTSVS